MDGDHHAVYREIIEEILETRPKTKDQLNAIKTRVCKRRALDFLPKNATILEHAPDECKAILRPLLQRRKTRTLSGVSVIAVMTKPIECPGNCIYCPGEASQPGEPVARSYTGKEPAALRSLANAYDPRSQVASRIVDLEAIGHRCDKIELIVMGGTFLASPVEYQESFIQGCIEGIVDERFTTFADTKVAAEQSARRLIGTTFETRPDYCTPVHVDTMLHFGGTRVEIGVQSVNDEVLDLVNRGHDVSVSQKAFQVARDAGFKVCAHVMPNLPGSNVEQDENMFHELFRDEAWKPDYLKIYPCLVIGGTILERWWRDGTYVPYPMEELVDMLARVKHGAVPQWARIQRVQRDIPAYLILDGVRNSNLREMIWESMSKRGWRCNCIRCNEYGFSRGVAKGHSLPPVESLIMTREYYPASGGTECFLKVSHPDTGDIIGYARLRKPSPAAHRSEIVSASSSIIRELRVVGEVVPVRGSAGILQAQHRGVGKALVQLAEETANREFRSDKLLVIAGLGVRSYFYGLGFKPDGPYVSKMLEHT